MSDLRNGFEAWASKRFVAPSLARWPDGHNCAGDYALSYIDLCWLGWQAARQHNGHAEFVRAVKAFCIDRSLHRHEKLTEIESLCDRALCDAELEKEQP